MMKPRLVLVKRGDDKLAVLHLSEDAVAAKEVWATVKSGAQGAGQFLLLNPWGVERQFKSEGLPLAELKPAKAIKVGK